MLWNDSHRIWAQHMSGSFAQLDVRYASKPLDAVPRAAVAWAPMGSLTFTTDRPRNWEIPFDDM